jgi:hypothetical protein
MMPDLRLREERGKKLARVGAFIMLSVVVAVTVLLRPGYQWVSLTVGVCGAIAVAASGDLTGGRGTPGPYEERRKKRARAAGFIASGTIIISGLVQPDWQWVPFAVGGSAAIAVAAVAARGDLPGGRGRSGHGRGSGLSGRGRDEDGPVGTAAHQWHLLVMVSRLMPGPAGRRWLTEAESLLSEITAGRRGAAIRSYLLSAPRLAAMMWAHEARRRARPGPRRPG